MPPVPRLRDYSGPPVLSYGFRLFYLAGALFAGLAVFAWLPLMGGNLEGAGAFSVRDWHIHELLYGFLPAIIGGYLLTAVPNWTGHFPVQGAPVVLLAITWAAGRAAILLSSFLEAPTVAVIDCAFLAVMIAAILREIIASRSARNLAIVAALALLLSGNIVFHLEVRQYGAADLGWRLGIATVIGLITMIGGRIIPSFTRNMLARQRPGRLPSPVGAFDHVCVATGVAALLWWAFAPYGTPVFLVLMMAGALHAVRIARWAGYRTAGDPLVFILHIAYAFIPIGFILTAFAVLGMVAPSAGVHAWTSGAAGTMVLAVMTRTSLGLTGRPRIAGAGTQVIYALAVAGALLRIAAALRADMSVAVLHAAGAAWASAYLCFFLFYWPVLTGPRADR
jgi:uncharacterized protein involved in response to NO